MTLFLPSVFARRVFVFNGAFKCVCRNYKKENGVYPCMQVGGFNQFRIIATITILQRKAWPPSCHFGSN